MIDKKIGHCILCGKGYKKWGWIKHHYKKEHPDSKIFFRVREIMEAHNKEAEMFIKSSKIGGWLVTGDEKHVKKKKKLPSIDEWWGEDRIEWEIRNLL